MSATRIHRGRAAVAPAARPDLDPVATEVLRHGLVSAAEQMKRALIRTSFSPVIYEILDFAAALYDHEVRLIAQAPSLPAVHGDARLLRQGAVEAVGGARALAPGDIVLLNVPYVTGSHQQDAAVVMPAFLDDASSSATPRSRPTGWTSGPRSPTAPTPSTSSRRATIFPGVKLYERGELGRRHLPHGRSPTRACRR